MKKFFVLFNGLVLACPLWAHHSTAMFALDQQMSADAVVVELEWTNPHAWLQVEIENDKGQAVQWGLEMGTPAALIREGWRPKILTPGDKITVTFNPLKNGEPGGNLVRVIKADGKILGKQ